MGEKLIVSGRNIKELYPHLNVWGFGIPLYLFIGGLAAGILIFATYFFLKGKEKEMPVTVKISTLIVPVIIILGLLFLIGDLHHKIYFWRLLTTFRISSPMSWGTWILTFVLILSVFWPLSYIDDIISYFESNGRKRWAKWTSAIKNIVERIGFLNKLVELTIRYRKAVAYVIFFLSIGLGIYTGILLSAFNARPLWNNPVLGLLFLTSGVSTGAAFIMWLSRDHGEKKLFSTIDIVLVGIELLLIFLMFLSMIWGTKITQQASEIFLGGEFTAVFWGIFVILGLVFPLILESLELKGYRVPIAIPAFLILVGGLVFRIIMVTAGQITTFTF